jgi:hypothetical protein
MFSFTEMTVGKIIGYLSFGLSAFPDKMLMDNNYINRLCLQINNTLTIEL